MAKLGTLNVIKIIVYYTDPIVPEQQFNMELIVNTIRSSENPQTHHQALLVLTAAARIYPVSEPL